MTAQERGMLLLGCSLGDERVEPLTARELLELERRVLQSQRSEGEVDEVFLLSLGFERRFVARVLALLNRERWLDAYLSAAERIGIGVLTRLSGEYPQRLIDQLGVQAPAALFYRGDASLLNCEGVSLVGSRDLSPTGDGFARRVGALAAQEDYVLISGGARGADRAAQQACLSEGGSAAIFVADRLRDHIPEPGTVYCSMEGYEVAFSSQRAHARNRLIHAMGAKTLVAQVRLRVGGTWSGATDNLQRGLSPVFCCDDGSEAVQALAALGAVPILPGMLHTLRGLTAPQLTMNAF